jgi:hypothetical protein
MITVPLNYLSKRVTDAYLAVFQIRDILRRILILGSLNCITDPGSGYCSFCH